jgi:hypothetical protein
VRHSRRIRLAVVGALCAAIGAGAGIAGSTAKSGKHARTTQRSAADPRPEFHRGPPVHAEAVVPNRAGTGFVTVTEDAGTVESVSGDQLTLKEGTRTLTYKTVTLTIPSNAKVYRNFATAQLGDLKSGDRAHVASSSDGTVVFANDASHMPPPDGPGRHHERGPGPGGPGGPPPPLP